VSWVKGFPEQSCQNSEQCERAEQEADDGFQNREEEKQRYTDALPEQPQCKPEKATRRNRLAFRKSTGT